MTTSWRWLIIMLLAAGWMVLPAQGQPGNAGIQTRELPPPPGMEGTSARPGTVDPRDNADKTTGAARNAPVAETPRTSGQPQKENQGSETRPPASMTTELRQDEQRDGATSTSRDVPNVQDKPKASASPSRRKQPVAAFWLVLPQDQTPR
ncbi:MAG TPA: hypothetical protein PLH06_03970 [Candidatus Hydrogenedentes bacterium]|nr:hypothetical protein [Candidatus Hydrogenedentota bacterium]